MRLDAAAWVRGTRTRPFNLGSSCVVIRSAAALKEVTIEEMRAADVVLVVSDLLGIDKKTAQDKCKETYLAHLAHVVGLGAELVALEGHSDEVVAVALSGDGARLATGASLLESIKAHVGDPARRRALQSVAYLLQAVHSAAAQAVHLKDDCEQFGLVAATLEQRLVGAAAGGALSAAPVDAIGRLADALWQHDEHHPAVSRAHAGAHPLALQC